MKAKKCKRCKKMKMLDRYPRTGTEYRGKKYLLNTCYSCRTEMRKEHKEKWNARAYTAKTYKCVYDPEPEAWYKDTVWRKGMVFDTLKDGHWAPGMWFMDQETGRYYEVQGNEEWYKVEVYLAECLDLDSGEENNLKCIPQRLVRSYGERQPPGGE